MQSLLSRGFQLTTDHVMPRHLTRSWSLRGHVQNRTNLRAMQHMMREIRNVLTMKETRMMTNIPENKHSPLVLLRRI